MNKSPFQFKQFSVAQNNCGMKVNTDGVLLGAWCDSSDANMILDIGTGTGVIALMMAQKNRTAQIHAIDIDQHACQQAKENFERSAWNGRLTALCTSLQNYNSTTRYDIIISNPPYFIDDQKNDSHQKNVARHSVALSYSDLTSGISRLLDDNGKAFLVLPAFNFSLFQNIAAVHKLFITRHTEVIALDGKAPYLVLLQLQYAKRIFTKTQITIQDSTRVFSVEYKAITKDFYLKF